MVDGKPNSITGKHKKNMVQAKAIYELDKDIELHSTLKLPKHIQPQRLKMYPVSVSHRFKWFELIKLIINFSLIIFAGVLIVVA